MTRAKSKPKASSKGGGKSTVTKKKSSVAIARDPRPSRRLKPGRYKFLPIQKRVKHPVTLPSAWKISKKTAQLLVTNWKVLLGIVLIYGFFNIVLVRGFNGGLDVQVLHGKLNQLFHGGFGHLASGFTIFALLVGSTNTVSSTTTGAYQTFLVLVTSLALVWTFRQVLADKTVRIRDGFYNGVYPLIPVMLVLVVVILQFVPMLIGGWLFATVMQNGIAVGGMEQFFWSIVFFGLSLLSLYLITSSLFALYIATLPGMTPLKALRSARHLVRHRRSSVLRKILFLPLALVIVAGIIMLPIIFLLPIVAQWVFFLLSMIALAAIHGYMYTLYRELINE